MRSHTKPLLLFGQLLVGPVAIAILGFMVSYVLTILLAAHDSELIAYGSYVFVGFFGGYIVQHVIPTAHDAGGKWIWVPPLALTIWFFFQVRVGEGNRVAMIPSFFQLAASRTGLPMIVFTLPLIGSACYSIALILRRRIDIRRSEAKSVLIGEDAGTDKSAS
jgi:hypothetical protein